MRKQRLNVFHKAFYRGKERIKCFYPLETRWIEIFMNDSNI